MYESGLVLLGAGFIAGIFVGCVIGFLSKKLQDTFPKDYSDDYVEKSLTEADHTDIF